MARARSLRLIVLALGIAVALGLLTLAASSPGMAHALTVVPATAFVAADGTDVGSCPQDVPCGTIQYAIDQAVAGDIIYVAGGVYTGTGDAVITLTKSITLYGGWDGAPTGDPVRDPEAYVTLLDGERQRRVVYIGNLSAATLDGFTIANGNGGVATAQCGNADGCGGGILVYQGRPVIANNVITNNVAAVTTSGYITRTTGYGGGLYLSSAAGTIVRGNLVISNAASTAYCGQGGGLCLETYGSHALIEANRIVSNSATTTNSTCAWGGGIAGGSSAVQIEGNLIEGNRANALDTGHGAGVYGWFARPAYVGNLVRGNRGGEAVYLAFYAATFEGNQVLSNQTGEGIYLAHGYVEDPVLTNNVVADSGAKALWVEAGASYPLTATLLHNTLAGDGGGYGLYVGSYVTLQMTNTIMAGFSCGITNTTPGDSTINADHTLFWDNDDDGIRGANAVDGDPAFVDPEAGNYHLGAGSAARDAGVDAGVTDDMDGDARPIGAGYDIGADESRLRVFLPLVLRN